MPDETSQQEQPKRGKREQGATKVRVISHCQHGKIDDVVTLEGAALADAVELGIVDPHPDAVAYAESLAAPKE